jgi:chromosome partitioning protein
MRTLVFSCLKGGSGKTTHSAHVAVALELMGKGPVVTMDLDPQGSFSAWWNDRPTATPAFARVEDAKHLPAKHAELAKAGFEWCIIDTPPQDHEINRTAIRLADLVIIPAKHSPHDIRAAESTVELCEQENKKFYFLLNETNGKAVTLSATRKLASMGPVIPHAVPKLNGYWESMIPGLTFQEVSQGTGAIIIDNVTSFLVGLFDKPAKKEKAHV